MTIIDEMFQRRNRPMGELRVASQAAASAAAHAMASSAGASPSTTVSPGVSRTDLALLRTQIDAVSAAQLALDKRVTSIDGSFVAMQVSLPSAVVEITTLAVVASSTARPRHQADRCRGSTQG